MPNHPAAKPRPIRMNTGRTTDKTSDTAKIPNQHLPIEAGDGLTIAGQALGEVKAEKPGRADVNDAHAGFVAGGEVPVQPCNANAPKKIWPAPDILLTQQNATIGKVDQQIAECAVRHAKASLDRAKRPRFGAKLRFPLADEARFIKAWFENPSITGAVSPSGKALARQMAQQVDPASNGPVIELGPGTGPVTQALLARGIAEERLVLVEYDADFCALLARRYPTALIIQGDAYHLSRTLAGRVDKAAAIVSSLPLLLRDAAARLELLDDAFGLMQPGAPYVQFTYGLKSPMPLSHNDGFVARRSPPVLLNLPPAHVWVYRAGEGVENRAAAALPFLGRLQQHTRIMRGQIVARAKKAHSAVAGRGK